jgi:tRNA (guanine37-N1)-methyltransferase
MFAGVGTFSVLMAKHGGAQTVFSIDVNPIAVEYMQTNIRLNRVQSQVAPILGDAKQVIQGLKSVANRVTMPLPEKAFEYLDYAVLALKPTN